MKDGHTALVSPSTQGLNNQTKVDVPFRQASAVTRLNDSELTEDSWEDLLDEGEISLNAAVAALDSEAQFQTSDSFLLCNPKERPRKSSLNVREHGPSDISENGSGGNLAHAIQMGGLSPLATRPPGRTSSGSCEDFEIQGAELAESSLMELLQEARSGQLLDTLDHVRSRVVKKAADFLFSAGLTEDAFVVYHWIYDSLVSARGAAPELLLSVAISLARSPATATQDGICRQILLKILHDRRARKDRESHGMFLLHAFLTMIFRRQEDLSRADYHCHRALKCFSYPRRQSARSNDAWQSLVWIACCHLEGSLTEERLKTFHRKLDVESCQRGLQPSFRSLS